MDQESIVLRAAEPTFEEGLVYGRFLDELAPGFRYTLGRRAVEVVAEAYVQTDHDLSYEHVTFAEREDAIIGVVSCYTGDQHRRSVDGALKRAIGDRGLWSMRTAMLAKWMRYFGPREDDEFYVWALAVSEGSRGEGIGTVLMDSTEDRARAEGSTRLALDADARNEGARRFYERRGMTVESEWPSLPLIPAAIIRMAKSL